MSELVNAVEKNLREHCLVPTGEPLLMAVSGGLDSMVLLHILSRLAPASGWKLSVAHLNHCLRGRASLADQALVRNAAKRLGLPFYTRDANVRRQARGAKLSLEMAAREVRHRFLAEAALKVGIRTVALAHHAGDQAELFLLRLLRGAGPEGLAGMKWRGPSSADPRVTLIRPMLDRTREDLREFAVSEGVEYREDATNADTDILRNRIRHELIPLLERDYSPGAVPSILRSMELIGAESECMADHAASWLCRPAGERSFDGLPLALQRRVIQAQLLELGLAPEFELIERLRRGTRPFTVSPGLTLRRDGTGNLRQQSVGLSSSRRGEKSEPRSRRVSLKAGGGVLRFGGRLIRYRFLPGKKISEPWQPGKVEFFDADKVGQQIGLRHWLPGDRFQPIGLPSAAKLQDLFVNRKIPRERRAELVLASTAAGELFWVEGVRIGEQFKICPDTRRVLRWECCVPEKGLPK